MYYFHIKENQIVGKGQVKMINGENIEVSKDVYDNSEKYIYQEDKIIPNPNYEMEQKNKEQERIARLYLTGADVERGIYQAIGMDFDDIIQKVEELSSLGVEEAIDLKALKIELKANHFYRGNPYVNAVGSLLGFTSEQLDKFFETNDYKFLVEENDDTVVQE